MPAKKRHVTLTPKQRERVEIGTRSYKHSECERRARILLLADTNQAQGAANDQTIAEAASVCLLTVEQVRRRFAEDGVEAARHHKEQTYRKEMEF